MEKNAKLRLYKTPRALVKTDALVLKAMGWEAITGCYPGTDMPTWVGETIE